MADFTKQDIQILMDGVEAWGRQGVNLNRIVAEVVTSCACQNCIPDPVECAAQNKKIDAEVKRRFDEEVQSRKERAIVLGAKLIAMRDSIVADEFFASIKVQ